MASSKIALAASGGYPTNMDTELAAQYLCAEHGIPVSRKTLQNWRAVRRGPVCRYLGSKPFYTRQSLDDFAATGAWSEESPHTKMAKARRARGEGPPAGVGRPRKSGQDKAKLKQKAEARP